MVYSIVIKEPETSNPYRSSVIHPSASPKTNKRNRSKKFGMCSRIKSFYKAPVVHFYYNFCKYLLILSLSVIYILILSFRLYLDILRLIFEFIQLRSSCRLFSIEHSRRKAIRYSTFTDSNHRNSLAYLHWKFDYRWNLSGQCLFWLEPIFPSLFIMYLYIISISRNEERNIITAPIFGI